MIKYLKAAWGEIGDGGWLGAVLPKRFFAALHLTVGLFCFPYLCIHALFTNYLKLTHHFLLISC